jgi:hypothetical protein
VPEEDLRRWGYQAALFDFLVIKFRQEPDEDIG